MNVLHMMCCRLFGYGIGIHLLQSEDPENMPRKTEINPKDNHISFQVISFELDSIVSPLYALNYSWIELFLLLNFFFRRSPCCLICLLIFGCGGCPFQIVQEE